MTRKIGQFFLWTAVIAWSFWLGGLLYEIIVITPLWSANLPNSVLEWNARPNFVVNPTRFYIPIVVTVILSSLLGMILSWKSGNGRLWLLLSTVCGIAAFVFTLVYFFPKNDVLFRNQNANLSGEEITAIAHAWLTANQIRAAIMAIGLFSALKAFKGKSTEN